MRFECKMCGNCCRLGGETRFTEDDLMLAFKNANMDVADFQVMYEPRKVGDLYFIQPNVDGSCKFLGADNLCTINAVKPTYCAAYIPPLDGEGSPTCDICLGVESGEELTQGEVDARNAIVEQF